MRTEPVLLVHGFASSFELNWKRNGWVDLLADAGREVVAVDLLGHGTARKSHDPADYTHLEDDVLAAIPDGVVVDAVGFSLGAITLIRAVGKAPERFGRVVLGGIGESNMKERDSDVVARAIEAGITDGFGDGPEQQLARAFAQFAANGSNDPLALAACMRRPRGALTVEELQRVTCPSMVVCGDRDFVLPATPVVDALPDTRFVSLRGADHFGTPQHFGFLDAALGFLEALP